MSPIATAALLLVAGCLAEGGVGAEGSDAKGAWNFQWNFGGQGAPEVVHPDPGNEIEPIQCPVVQGCLTTTNCNVAPGNTCNTAQEPITMCHDPMNFPAGCQRVPGVIDCVCTPGAAAVPPCPLVPGCMLQSSCTVMHPWGTQMLCDSTMEPGTMCYDPTALMSGCQMDGAYPVCACLV